MVMDTAKVLLHKPNDTVDKQLIKLIEIGS